MTKLITTSQLQQKIGEVSYEIFQTTFIVTNRGQGRMVLLPYFDGCDENISEYMENYEMAKNAEKLKKKYKKSSQSGKGTLKI